MSSYLQEGLSPSPAPVRPSLGTQDNDILTAGILLKVLLLTAALLGAAYAILRFYSKHLEKSGQSSASDKPILHCEASLRLSPRTRTYLVTVGEHKVLITESPSASHSLLLPERASAQQDVL